MRHWVLGALVRLVVFVGIEAAGLGVSAWDAARPGSSSTAAIGIGLVVFALQAVLAAGWGFAEGRRRLTAAFALSRWLVVIALSSVVAPAYNQLGGGVDWTLLGTDVLGGLLVFGAPVLLAAAGGWAVGTSVRRRPARVG